MRGAYFLLLLWATAAQAEILEGKRCLEVGVALLRDTVKIDAYTVSTDDLRRPLMILCDPLRDHLTVMFSPAVLRLDETRQTAVFINADGLPKRALTFVSGGKTFENFVQPKDSEGVDVEQLSPAHQSVIIRAGEPSGWRSYEFSMEGFDGLVGAGFLPRAGAASPVGAGTTLSIRMSRLCHLSGSSRRPKAAKPIRSIGTQCWRNLTHLKSLQRRAF